jgi:hypothetical protein
MISRRTSFRVTLHLTLSLSPLIALLRRRPSSQLRRFLVCASHRRLPALDPRCEPGIWARRSADGPSAGPSRQPSFKFLISYYGSGLRVWAESAV